MTLLADFFLLPLPNCFPRVCLSRFAAVLKFFLPFTTSAVSSAAKSNNLAATRFAAGTKILRKNGFACLATTCASAPNPRPQYRPMLLQNGFITCLEATISYCLLG